MDTFGKVYDYPEWGDDRDPIPQDGDCWLIPLTERAP